MTPEIDLNFTLDLLERLIKTPSLPGACEEAFCVVDEAAAALGLCTSRDRRGSRYLRVPGKKKDRTVLVAAHMDTVGLMVRAIREDGTLALAPLGGPNPRSIENELVQVHTAGGRLRSGVIYHDNHSMHFPQTASPDCPQGIEHLHVLLDDEACCAEDVKNLGIAVGDFVSLKPRFRRLPSGYISSRFLDDKACAACAVGAAKSLLDAGLAPSCETILAFTGGEEVAQSCYVPPDTTEYLALDVGLIGGELSATQRDVAIIRSGSRGPYDKVLFDRLVALAGREGIPFQPAVYWSKLVSYGTDADTARNSGADALFAAFGPAVYAAHALERTHTDALAGTIRLLVAYLLEDWTAK